MKKDDDLTSPFWFLHRKYQEVDGDCMNLTIMSDERIRKEEEFNKITEEMKPTEISETGARLFKREELETIYNKL